jgi:hypothetical protein
MNDADLPESWKTMDIRKLPRATAALKAAAGVGGGDDPEPNIPHEQVVGESRAMLDQLAANQAEKPKRTRRRREPVPEQSGEEATASA